MTDPEQDSVRPEESHQARVRELRLLMILDQAVHGYIDISAATVLAKERADAELMVVAEAECYLL